MYHGTQNVNIKGSWAKDIQELFAWFLQLFYKTKIITKWIAYIIEVGGLIKDICIHTETQNWAVVIFG